MTKRTWAFTLVILLLAAGAFAQDDALARTASVPLGERVCGYLQSYLDGLGLLARAKGAKPLEASLFYNPGGRCLMVLTAGKAADPAGAQAQLEKLQKVLLAAAPKVKEAFGLDLTPADLRLIYFSGTLDKTLLVMEGGKALPAPGPTPGT